MRRYLNSVAILMVSSLMNAQVPASDPARLELLPACAQDPCFDAPVMAMAPPASETFVAAPVPPAGHGLQLKAMVKKQIDQAMMSENRPSLEAWQPMTTQEKFQTFVRSFSSPGTYASASADAVTEKLMFNDPGYERGWAGLGQYYAVMLAGGQTDIFFRTFMLPTLLKQDPRYYRNPDLSFSKRFFYSTTRVFVTRTDHGGETFNGSIVLGSAARQALKGLYVPGEPQGIGAIGSRVAVDLLREAGSNLMHEFWPDVRRKFFHR